MFGVRYWLKRDYFTAIVYSNNARQLFTYLLFLRLVFLVRAPIFKDQKWNIFKRNKIHSQRKIRVYLPIQLLIEKLILKNRHCIYHTYELVEQDLREVRAAVLYFTKHFLVSVSESIVALTLLLFPAPRTAVRISYEYRSP